MKRLHESLLDAGKENPTGGAGGSGREAVSVVWQLEWVSKRELF